MDDPFRPVYLLGGSRMAYLRDPLSFRQDMEIQHLAAILGELGYATQRLKDGFWPRDVFFEAWGHDLWNATGTSMFNKDDLAGTGGCMVPSMRDRFLLVSDGFAADQRALINRRYQGVADVFEVPAGFQWHGAYATPGGHIDYSLAIWDAHRLILADQVYLEAHGPVLASVQKHLADQGKPYQLVTIPQSEKKYHPANMLLLDDGRALMNYAPQTLEAIRAAAPTAQAVMLDGEHALQANFKNWNGRYLGGGIRCLTNHYYPAVDILIAHGIHSEFALAFVAWLKEHSPEERTHILQQSASSLERMWPFLQMQMRIYRTHHPEIAGNDLI